MMIGLGVAFVAYALSSQSRARIDERANTP